MVVLAGENHARNFILTWLQDLSMQQVTKIVFDIGVGTQALEQDMVSATVDNIMTVIEGIQSAHHARRKLTVSGGLAVFECSCWRSTTLAIGFFDHGRRNF